MPTPPKILTRKTVATSNIFSIEQLHLKFSNGNERTFERLLSRSNGAVMIVPLLDNDTMLLVREYAAGVERYELSFPKGIVDPGEDFLQAANRELQEEVGYGAKNIKVIMETTTSPGYWGSSAAILLARDLYPSKLEGDEPEPLEVIPWRIKDYKELLKQKDFTEARSIAALLLLQEILD